MKRIFQAIYSTKAIYDLRSTPLFLTLVVGLVIGVLHFSPFTFLFFNSQTYRFDSQNWQLTEAEQTQLLQALPADCYFEDSQFHCDEVLSFHLRDDLSLHINYVPEVMENGLIFETDRVRYYVTGQAYTLGYFLLEGLSVHDLQVAEAGYDKLFNALADGLRGILIVPFVFGAYQTGIITYFVYILGISILAMLLKFAHTSFISFKEMVTIMVFSSILPSFVVIIVGFIVTPAFSTLIFNVGTPLWAYLVYRRQVVPGLLDGVNTAIGNAS